MDIQELRKQGLSLAEISKRTGHKIHVVTAELDKAGLLRRTKSQASYYGHLQRRNNDERRRQQDEMQSTRL